MRLPSLVTGLALMLVVSTTLSSCSVIGPHAHPVLLDLAQQADNDAAMATDPHFKAVRSTQATELKEEITRLCGVRSDGTPYPSCAEDLSQPVDSSQVTSDDAAGVASSVQTPLQVPAGGTNQWIDTARQISDDVDKVPAQSRELLAREALDLVKQAPRPDTPPLEPVSPSSDMLRVIPDDDQKIMEEVLRREYATVYYLGLALGYLDDTHALSYQRILHIHQQCADDLNAALSTISVSIAPEVTYDLGDYPHPMDDASAVALADAARRDAARHVLLAASQVTNSDLRWWLLSYAGADNADISGADSDQLVPAQ